MIGQKLVVVVKIMLVSENNKNQMGNLMVILMLKLAIHPLEIPVLIGVVLVYPHQQGNIHVIIHSKMTTMDKLVTMSMVVLIFAVEEVEEVRMVILLIDFYLD